MPKIEVAPLRLFRQPGRGPPTYDLSATPLYTMHVPGTPQDRKSSGAEGRFCSVAAVRQFCSSLPEGRVHPGTCSHRSCCDLERQGHSNARLCSSLKSCAVLYVSNPLPCYERCNSADTLSSCSRILCTGFLFSKHRTQSPSCHL